MSRCHRCRRSWLLCAAWLVLCHPRSLLCMCCRQPLPNARGHLFHFSPIFGGVPWFPAATYPSFTGSSPELRAGCVSTEGVVIILIFKYWYTRRGWSVRFSLFYRRLAVFFRVSHAEFLVGRAMGWRGMRVRRASPSSTGAGLFEAGLGVSGLPFSLQCCGDTQQMNPYVRPTTLNQEHLFSNTALCCISSFY